MNASLPILSAFNAALLVIGVGVGLALGYFLFPAMRQAKRLRAELDGLRLEHDTYKAGVAEHFEKTADLVGEMTKSYAAVYDHLAGGARRFCGDTVAGKALAFAPQVTIPAGSRGGPSGVDDGVTIETRAAENEGPSGASFPDAQDAPAAPVSDGGVTASAAATQPFPPTADSGAGAAVAALGANRAAVL